MTSEFIFLFCCVRHVLQNAKCVQEVTDHGFSFVHHERISHPWGPPSPLPRHTLSASLVSADSQERLWKLNKTQVGGVQQDVITTAQPSRLSTFCLETKATMEHLTVISNERLIVILKLGFVFLFAYFKCSTFVCFDYGFIAIVVWCSV